MVFTLVHAGVGVFYAHACRSGCLNLLSCMKEWVVFTLMHVELGGFYHHAGRSGQSEACGQRKPMLYWKQQVATHLPCL